MRENNSLNCPFCHNALERVSTDPLSDWGGEELLVCFNNDCSYFVHSWSTMAKQGVCLGYRYYFSESAG